MAWKAPLREPFTSSVRKGGGDDTSTYMQATNTSRCVREDYRNRPFTSVKGTSDMKNIRANYMLLEKDPRSSAISTISPRTPQMQPSSKCKNIYACGNYDVADRNTAILHPEKKQSQSEREL